MAPTIPGMSQNKRTQQRNTLEISLKHNSKDWMDGQETEAERLSTNLSRPRHKFPIIPTRCKLRWRFVTNKSKLIKKHTIQVKYISSLSQLILLKILLAATFNLLASSKKVLNLAADQV